MRVVPELPPKHVIEDFSHHQSQFVVLKNGTVLRCSSENGDSCTEPHIGPLGIWAHVHGYFNELTMIRIC